MQLRVVHLLTAESTEFHFAMPAQHAYLPACDLAMHDK